MNQTSVYHPRRFSPASLAVILSLHGAAITAALLAKMEFIDAGRSGPIVVRPIPIDKDPPAQPTPKNPRETAREDRVQVVPTPIPSQADDQSLSDTVVAPFSGADEPVDRPPPPPIPEPMPVSRSASAKGDVRTLFDADDYPDSARQRGQTGTVQAKLDIGPNGKVTGCNIVRSSGSTALDSATCRILRSRARFTPATDGSGVAIADSYVTPRITWKIEDGG